MASKASKGNINPADAYAPPIPATTAAIRDPLEPLTVYDDGTIVLPRQLTHDNIAREVKLANLSKELKPDFEGVETEDNWGRRETNIIVLRKLTCSSVPDERTNLYISTFRGLIDGIVKSATSLRTSLSLQGTGLIQEAAKAVGPGLDHTFDILYPALEKLALTKPAQAQAGNNAMIALITHLSFHHRIMESIAAAMDSKNKALRGYVIGWLEALIQHCPKHTLETEMESVEKILRKGLSDADGTVRERTRAVFWTYSGKLKTRADIIYGSLPKQTQKALDSANSQGVLNSKSYDTSLNRGPPPPRPATSHADRSSLKQFIKDKKKEANKVDQTPPSFVDRPKSAGPGHERNQPVVKRPVRAPVPSRPESAASTASMDRRHGKQPSQDLKKAPRRVDPVNDEQLSETPKAGATTAHAYKKPVRRPIERPDSAMDRPKSSSSTASSVVPSKAVRPTAKAAVPARPKTVASVSSAGTGTLSSAPKRPNFKPKVAPSANTPSTKSTMNISTDSLIDLSHDTVPAHIAHVVTPPRVLQEPLPLQNLPNPPQAAAVKDSQISIKDEHKKLSKDIQTLPEFSHSRTIDARNISPGTLNVMSSLISDKSNEVPKDAFEILSSALERGDVSVRRAGMDLGVALWKRIDDPMIYWSQLEGLAKNSKDFLMYWINRDRSRA